MLIAVNRLFLRTKLLNVKKKTIPAIWNEINEKEITKFG
jgi:hypothetical protein